MPCISLLNTNNYHSYSHKFSLRVVNLYRTDLATDEDKTYGIDSWIKIFKTQTWEELRILSENNEYVAEMIRSLYKIYSDEQIREQCEDIEIVIAARKARHREQLNTSARLEVTLVKKYKEIVLLKALLKEHNIELQ